MPVLPSGLQVVVLTSPRFRAWTRLVGREYVCKFLGIERPEHMYPWLQVAYVVKDEPLDLAVNTPRPHKKGEVPYSLHLEDTGYTLDKWSACTAEWSEEDKTAMQKWMNYDLYISLIIAWVGAGKKNKQK